MNVPLYRNLQIGYLMVEGASEEEDLEDPYQGGLPTCLPYTLESFKAGSKQSPGFPKKRGRAQLFLLGPSILAVTDPMRYLIDRSKGCACAHVFDKEATILIITVTKNRAKIFGSCTPPC